MSHGPQDFERKYLQHPRAVKNHPGKPLMEDEDLDPPYSAFPHVNIESAPFPENARYGLGIRHVSPFGQFVFEPWTVMEFNDYFALYIGDLDNPIKDDLVTVRGVKQHLFFPQELVPEGEMQVFGRVRRSGSGTPSRSPTQTFLIKTRRPGGNDADPGSPWHTGLIGSVEGFEDKQIIRPEDIVDGLCFLVEIYEQIRHNDRIDLSWNGVFVRHHVTPEEAAGNAPVRVSVPKSVIESAGQAGELNIRFRIQDVCENFSGEKYQYSKPFYLQAELSADLLPAPRFLVDGEELNPSQIDFDTQGEALFQVLVNTTIQVPTPSPRHRITVFLHVTLLDGTSDVHPIGPITDRNFGAEYVAVPNITIERIIGGSFRVSYHWHDAAGNELGQSRSLTITVVGVPRDMPPVVVTPSELGLIPANTDILVNIPPYQPHDRGWWEKLVIQHVPAGGGNGIVYDEELLAGEQGGTRSVTAEQLRQFNGVGPVDFFYSVNDGASRIAGGNALTIRKSQVLRAQVGERIPNMPRAILQGVIGNNVDPAHVVGPEVRITFPYTGTRDRDILYWTCIGSRPDGSANGHIQINGATAGKPLPYPVSRDILDNNLNGNLRITYSLLRPGSPPVVLRSEELRVTVGKGIQLHRPVIAGAMLNPDRLNPLAALGGTSVLARFSPILDTDVVYVDWLSTDGLGSTTVAVQGNAAADEVEAPISEDVIAKGIRGTSNTIDVQYRFMRDSFPFESEIVQLELLPLEGLPETFIQGIGDNTQLDLSKLVNGALTLTPAWHFIHEDCTIWLEYEGTYQNDLDFQENTYEAHRLGEHDVSTGLRPLAPVEDLRLLKDGSLLTIRVWVGFSGSVDRQRAILFPVREYTIQVSLFRDLTDFFGHNRNGWINTVSGRGDLVIEGAENVIWRAAKTAGETVQPGLQKNYPVLKASTSYELSFYCKTSGTTSPTTAHMALGVASVSRSVTPNRNWEKFSHVFTTPSTPPTQNLNARISFTINTAAVFMVDQIQVREVPLIK